MGHTNKKHDRRGKKFRKRHQDAGREQPEIRVDGSSELRAGNHARSEVVCRLDRLEPVSVGGYGRCGCKTVSAPNG